MEIKIVVLTNQQVLVSQIEEVGASIPGEPDCKLTNPFILKREVETQLVLEPFLIGVSKEDVFMISSDKILTLADPTPTLQEKYEDLIKE